MVLLTLSGEIFVKSSRTRRRFMRALADNLAAGLADRAPGAGVVTSWNRIDVEGGDQDAAARVAADTFGVVRAQTTRPLPNGSLEELAEAAAGAARDRVRDRTFAVRVRKREQQAWRTVEAERLIGSLLLDDSAGVDLTNPEVEVRVEVFGERAFLVEETHPGPDGLPLGVQGRILALLSGGFDSAVAAWMMMRRGSPVDFLHFKLDCGQSDHALAVAHELVMRWGHGSEPLAHVVDFQPVKEALQERVSPRLRQVVLKQLMVAGAEAVAGAHGLPALVTGESVGQVSSQTLDHLAAIDRFAGRTVLRPLAGLGKQEIIDRARQIGTYDLSARAKEVCDLSDGPVAVAAGRRELEEAHRALPEELVARAVAERRLVAVRGWSPGDPLIPVVPSAPEGVPVARTTDALPDGGPVAVRGRGAPARAAELHRSGRQVWVVVDDGRAKLPAG